MSSRFCVYTALTGNYEKLNEQPVAAGSNIDFICYTDDASLKSKTWKVIKIDPMFADDPVRSQRVVKLSPHEYCADYDVSLYIDNSVILSVKPEDIFERYCAHWDFLLPSNSYRKCILDEFRAVKTLSLVDTKRLNEQLAYYIETDVACLKEQPYWAGVQIRRHANPSVRNAMRLWLAHVLRFTRRDQLSANFAFRQTGVTPYRLNIDNSSSWFHGWPVYRERNEAMRKFNNGLINRMRTRLSFETNLLVQRLEIKRHFSNRTVDTALDGEQQTTRNARALSDLSSGVGKTTSNRTPFVPSDDAERRPP
jgi:hypothetical protein